MRSRTNTISKFESSGAAAGSADRVPLDGEGHPDRVLRIVTTSWDDGDRSDLRLAGLLNSKQVRGTFYVPINQYRAGPVLNKANLKSLSSEGFEIGAHGVSHQYLPRLSAAMLARDVRTCKEILENTLGEQVSMFCYPGGRYNRRVIRALKKAGYKGGRTVRMLSTKLDFNPFEMPTSLQVYPHSGAEYLKNLITARDLPGLYEYVVQWRRAGAWLQLGKKLFDSVLKEGGIWHLYGHSWEIEELGLWEDLGSMLDYVSGHKDVLYTSNAEALKFLPAGFSDRVGVSA
jgi:peptidoglycan-N-acetylglucosamine deacetylase